MFEFTAEDTGHHQLDVARAEISLFANVPPWKDQLSLNVMVVSKPIMVPYKGDAEDLTEVSPVFFTEWLSVPVSAFVSRDLGLLDGYEMRYDWETEAEDGFDQSPGALQNGSYAMFDRATMRLDHLADGRYRVRAEGETEFHWRFRIDTEAVLNTVIARADPPESQPANPQDKSKDVERFFIRHFDQAHFPAVWSRRGSPASGWFDYNWER